MAELTAQDIKVFDGTNWVSGFNINDGTNWQNINDGKVNIRGGDGNWYKKGGTTSSIFSTLALAYYAQEVASTWSTARDATDCQIFQQNNAHIVTDYTGSYYMISRLICQFDLSSITNIGSAVINTTMLPNSTLTSTKMYIYAVNKITSFTSTDYANFGVEIGNGVIDTNGNCSITLNTSGIAHLNAYKGGNVSIMLREQYDAENITPSMNRNYSLETIELVLN